MVGGCFHGYVVAMKTMATAKRMALGLGTSLLGSGALILSFPPFGLWPLALVGLVPMLLAQFRLLPRRFSSLSSSLGIGLWLGVTLGPALQPMGGIAPFIPLFIALALVLMDAGQRRFHNRTRYHFFLVSGVAAWSGFEMIRLLIPSMGSWGFIAHPFYSQPWLLQPLSVFGIIAMGALIVSVNYALALLALQWFDRRWDLGENPQPISDSLVRKSVVTVAASLVLWTGLSLILYALPANEETITVGAIQPEAPPTVSANAGDNARVEKIYSSMVEQTRSAAAQGAQLVVWPEGSLYWDPQVDDRLELAALARELSIHLALGYVVYLDEGFRNEATIIDPNGRFLGVFGKDHPVVLSGETSLSRGSYPSYPSAIGTLATIICYDLDFTDTARKVSAGGAQVIAVPSNDWPSIAHSHYTHVVFRAVENGVAMVKADGGFDSAIIDPKGRIVQSLVLPEGGVGTLVASVALGTGNRTVYNLLGDWIGWVFIAIMAFFSFGQGIIAKRYKAVD